MKRLKNIMVFVLSVFCFLIGIIPATAIAAPGLPIENESVSVRIAFGVTSASRRERSVQLIAGSPKLEISGIKGSKIEKNDLVSTVSRFNCGLGDIDEIVADISWPVPVAPKLTRAKHVDDYSINGDGMWGYLMEEGSPGQISRLKQDTWDQPDAPRLTLQFNSEGTEGFSVPLQLLKEQGTMWLPEHDVFISLADKQVDYFGYIKNIKRTRTIDLIHEQPEASLEEYQKLWPDIGNPVDWNVSWQTRYKGTTGHLTVIAPSHGSIYKYAIDRWANIRPDFASPYKYRFDHIWPGSEWKGQKIINGLPIIVTDLEKNGQQSHIEQFSSPLTGISTAVRGYVPGVLFTKLSFTGNGALVYNLGLNNELKERKLNVTNQEGKWIITDVLSSEILLLIETNNDVSVSIEKNDTLNYGTQVTLKISADLSAGSVKDIIVKLPSPAVNAAAGKILMDLGYEEQKNNIVKYWEEWLARGAYFKVPEEKVNELFRANLWHSLVLPRHTINDDSKLHMDLPYANTAYGQKNADWPVNQAVYVDYMIYGLRGYDAVATEEIAAMFQSQMQKDGRIGGFANWGVYSPAHIYTIAQNYLLSRNKEDFERLLPKALLTLDWCVANVDKANEQHGNGLIIGALNDLTHAEREWAFTQAYYVAGLQKFSEALAIYGHPRAGEVQKKANKMKDDVVKEFARSSVKSPVVQLGDGTWTNYVPTDAMTPRRMIEQWYPTDVDCGPLHLSRLEVFEPFSWLTTAMLNDHEDNLFLKNLGAANEPVYVQHGNTYLLRDDPKAVIRSFYSFMAYAFSHEQLTSLEHRWAWGQYYGPPSTDGAWFELYRRMLVNEIGNDTLMIGQAIPRAWLESGKTIEVKNAPTYFGPLSFQIESENVNTIKANITISDRNRPGKLVVRFRHPQQKPIRSVTVNGKVFKNFNADREQVIINNPSGNNFQVLVKY